MKNCRLIMQLLFSLSFLGCSKVQFSQNTADSCSSTNLAYGENSCEITTDGKTKYDYTVQTGDVDILFVDDNSGSMYTEQEKMANQFPGFLNSISNLSYHIAIITTDVTGEAPGQDGRFLEFSPGETMLANDSRQIDSLHYGNIAKFQNIIKRSETLLCPNLPGCPSGDERAIYALNRAMARPENAPFFRPGGHLAVVILSDEDERSSGGGAPGSSVNGGPVGSSYLAQQLDLPETFVETASRLLPADKSFSVHSIVIRPSTSMSSQDVSCWQQQNSQGGGVKGFYGTQYAELSAPTSTLVSIGNLLPGTLGSICSSDYTVEMGNIADHIKQEDLQLPCLPDMNTIKVDFDPALPGPTTFDVDEHARINFLPALPAGTKVHLQFTCLN